MTPLPASGERSVGAAVRWLLAGVALARRGGAIGAIAAFAGLAVAGAAPPARAETGVAEPFAVARRLTELGPRVPGGAAHQAASRLLLEALSSLGLEDVHLSGAPDGPRNVEALLPGADPGAGEIVLAAHYDTVAGSPGAADDAAGCAVVLAAVAEVQRTPLRRGLRILLFDGEEAGLLGSSAWVGGLAPPDRERILAAVHLDVVGLGRAGTPVVLDLGHDARLAAGAAAPARTPAWLVHAVLEAGAAVGFEFAAGDRAYPLAAQVLARTARMPWSSDAAAVLAGGIPAVLLTDFSVLHPDGAIHTPDDRLARLDAERLAQWATVTAAVVRRLDGLAGRPRWEEEYLALGGRVWIRRDLLWVGLALWILLVLRGRPGPWAGARADERRARGRSYLPGYLFRFTFLAAAIWIPSLAAPLLYPLAPLALIAARSTAARALVAGAAVLPVVLWLALLGFGSTVGLTAGYALPAAKTLLLLSTVAAFSWQLWSPRPPSPRAAPAPAPGAPESSRSAAGGGEHRAAD